MQALAETYWTHLLTFALVAARVGGMAATAPLFSAVAVPLKVRAFVAFALALLIAPAQFAFEPPVLNAPIDIALAAGTEVLTGMALGFGAAIIIAAAQLAGQLVAQMSGLSAAELFDPAIGGEAPVLSQFTGLLASAVYLVSGGHRLLIAGLLDTFVVLPVAGARTPGPIVDTLIALVGESFSLGIRAAAPMIIALLISTMILGLIGRTLPQLNIFSLGFGLNTVVACGALAIAFGSMAWLFEEQLQQTISSTVRAVGQATVVRGTS